jgi:hypothetical protein
VLASTWLPVRQAVQPVLRAFERNQTLSSLEGYHQQASEHYDLYYKDADASLAPLVLATAERVWAPVLAQMNARPRERVPLIMYASREDLRAAFGWGQSESALGVYWRGTIRLLSPNVWLDRLAPAQQEAEFIRLNPIAHELTHYILDERTGGNYPRWFTEALAQDVEERVTGYLWLEPNPRLSQNLYTYSQLNSSFQDLPNQPLAYRQSYLFLHWLGEQNGQSAVEGLIRRLAKGEAFALAFASNYGALPEQLFGEWQDWAVAHAAELDDPVIP